MYRSGLLRLELRAQKLLLKTKGDFGLTRRGKLFMYLYMQPSILYLCIYVYIGLTPGWS